jgi:hypothetical protein
MIDIEAVLPATVVALGGSVWRRAAHRTVEGAVGLLDPLRHGVRVTNPMRGFFLEAEPLAEGK